jgi:hypothetical protein
MVKAVLETISCYTNQSRDVLLYHFHVSSSQQMTTLVPNLMFQRRAIALQWKHRCPLWNPISLWGNVLEKAVSLCHIIQI